MRATVDQFPWPATLSAKVVDSHEAHPLVHGYSVDDDLAVHYRFSDVMFLFAVGELPSDDAARAFDVAMMFASAVSAGDASVHAASLAQLCGAYPRSVVGVAAVGAANRASMLCDDEVFAWLNGSGKVPRTAGADPRTEALRRALPATFASLPIFDQALPIDLAIVAVLFASGVRDRSRLEMVLTFASMLSGAAEAFATKPLSFRDYPMGLPAFDYSEEVEP